MNKRSLLLEIGLEEMPARFVTDSMNQLGNHLEEWLRTKNIAFGNVILYSTPRRLAVLIKDIDEKQADVEEEVRGPAKKIALDNDGNWSKAALGFIKGQGVEADQIVFKEQKGVEYVFVNKFLKGQETFRLLQGELKDIILGVTFPKNMKWASFDLKYVRPIQWICALFGSEVIPVEIANVTSNRISKGHRFLGETVELDQPENYEQELLRQFVIADPSARKESILTQLKKMEKDNNWIIPVDEDLLEEVTNLVEYPTAVTGNFDSSFLSIPSEVLITSMKEHQRYFPVTSLEGNLLPHFITFRNGDHRNIDNVARGNEKVLRARLADAEFFYVEDQKLHLDDALKKLNKIVFHEDLGTTGEKVNRITYFANAIGSDLTLADSKQQLVERAAKLCKFDLVTHMVYEFPELQGIMGEKYARLFGEEEEVAIAINEHYKPRSASDDPAKTDIGAIIGLADKLDTIVGFFSIGILPTGSQDPYGLRRQASGIVQTLLAKKWDMTLEKLIEIGISYFEEKQLLKREKQEVIKELKQFFQLRVKNLLQDQGVRYDIIDSLKGQSLEENIARLSDKAKYMMEHVQTQNFKNVVEALSRVTNIAGKATSNKIDVSLFLQDEEKSLFNAYQEIKEPFFHALNKGEVDKAFTHLASLKEYIDPYFDNIMVMDDKEEIKQNRLGQMAILKEMINSFATFTLIVFK